MSTAETASLLPKVKAWLLARKPEAGDIEMDLDLIENRLIDSLGFLEFVFFLEELGGREIKFDGDSLHKFRSLRAINENIFGAQ
ncbi:MAG: hypothetical protein DMF61_13610 [Blastocatellia bacterium AA13]|nr:MAG: hypothetical protein DMF61_13610 [Blastocatellia bacterium AA13]